MHEWYKIGKYSVKVNEGKVTYGTVKTLDGVKTVYPYVSARDGGLDNVSGELTVSQLRQRIKRGTAAMR